LARSSQGFSEAQNQRHDHPDVVADDRQHRADGGEDRRDVGWVPAAREERGVNVELTSTHNSPSAVR